MSAAILQGVPATTLDTDLWIDLPERQYMRILRLCCKLGGTVRANTVVELSDGSVVNFLYQMDGLGGFNYEFKRARRIRWLGAKVAVCPWPAFTGARNMSAAPKTSPTCTCWSKPWSFSASAERDSEILRFD